jgi:C4-type Zn-finger protein
MKCPKCGKKMELDIKEVTVFGKGIARLYWNCNHCGYKEESK